MASQKIKQLQNTPDELYGDIYNRLICEMGDASNTSDLRTINRDVYNDMVGKVTDQEIVEMITSREIQKQQQRVTQSYSLGLSRLNNSEKASQFAALVFEINRRETERPWGRSYQEVVINGLNGNPVQLISILCTINEFDYKGGYNLSPNLDTYKRNPKVEPVPLIVDEMASIISLFNFYGISSSLMMYVADTDYTEIGANGPVTEKNLQNLEQYMINLRRYVARYSGLVSVAKISEVTQGNPVYEQTKKKVLDWVTRRRDVDFNYLWGNKFEEDVERRTETFGKKKLCPKDQVRRESLRVAQNIWAVNAAQGAVFNTVADNCIFLSTERRERDTNYVVDKMATKNFPPVLYVLQAAEMWNRKIVNKAIFEAN